MTQAEIAEHLKKRYRRNFDEYSKKLEEISRLEQEIMSRIVTMIKTIAAKPIHIGNYWYYYCEYKGKEVPAECHETDYRGDNKVFQPIYDEDETYEFGNVKFINCCRVFDVIEERLNQK